MPGSRSPQMAIAMTSVAESPDHPPGVLNPKGFRRAWRALDPPRRERLSRLVRRGQPAQNPSDAFLAVGLARRQKCLYAGLLFIAPLLSIGMMLGLAALSNRSPDPAAHIPLGWSLVVAVPVALLVEAVGLLAWIRVRRAEIVNACIAQGKPAPNQPLAPPLRRLEQALVRFEQAFDSETRRRGQWHCPRCGRRIPDEKAPPTTAIGGRGLQPGWRRSSSS